MASMGFLAAKALIKGGKNWWLEYEERLRKLESNSGTGGGDMPLLVVEDEWEGTGNITRTFSKEVMGVSIINNGPAILTASLGNKTIQVDPGETFENLFKPFTTLSIVTTGSYKALVTAPYNSAPPDTTPPLVTISPVAGSYASTQNIIISANEAATIFYTVDGSVPTTGSAVYSGPIVLNSSAVIRYFARDVSGNSSAVQNAVYTITGAPDITPPVVNLIPVAGTYTSMQNVVLSADEAATIYYTTDGSMPTTASQIYSAPISIVSTTTLRYFARDAAGNSSEVLSAVFTIAIPDTTPPTVTILPAAGTYTSIQNVTLSANESATIFYTTDGTTPTTASAVYSSPIEMAQTTTLRYFARDVANNVSAVQSAVFTINIPVQRLELSGTGSGISGPSMTVDQLVMDLTVDSTQVSSTYFYYVDYRPTIQSWMYGQVAKDDETMNGLFNQLIIDGVTYTQATAPWYIPRGTRTVLDLKASAPITAPLLLFRKNDNTFSMKATIYRVRGYNAGVLVFDYNMALGNVQDQSGNNRHGTLTGGNWVSS